MAYFSMFPHRNANIAISQSYRNKQLIIKYSIFLKNTDNTPKRANPGSFTMKIALLDDETRVLSRPKFGYLGMKIPHFTDENTAFWSRK